MPKLLHAKTFIQFFELDKGNETVNLSAEAAEKWLLWNQFRLTEDLRKWAEVNYPNAPVINTCCFAGLMPYLATGAYGGYGTENVQMERFAEYKAYEFYKNLQEVLSPEEMTITMIYFVISHLLQKPPLEESVKENLKKSIDLLENSKKSFKSPQIAEARKILQKILG